MKILLENNNINEMNNNINENIIRKLWTDSGFSCICGKFCKIARNMKKFEISK